MPKINKCGATPFPVPLSDLTDSEREIVYRCLRVAADEPTVYPDWEFQTIFGLLRPDFAAIADRWPNLDDDDQDVRLAINNSLNNLLGYPHKWQKEWDAHFAFSWTDVRDVFVKWRGERIANHFEGML